jgi:hydrogenase expression/formation protein HypE
MREKEIISLKEGEGTSASFKLIKDIFLKKLNNNFLKPLGDSAYLNNNFVYTCDSFTVNPIFFPSSDIGKLSIYGTVNDLVVSGANPLYLTLAVIVEEGFLKKDLERIVDSISIACKETDVKIVGGDFKVVERKKADKIFITTAGLGKRISKSSVSSFERIRNGDKIIITGSIAEHGISVMLSREKIFDFDIESDCQSLKRILLPLWRKFKSIHFMRDPTRGGIAATLNEIWLATGLGIKVFEERIPLKEEVKNACEILGIDPYYLACEGRAVIVVDKKEARKVLKELKKTSPSAEIIGEVNINLKKVILKTIAGGERILDFIHSFNLPRIC